MKLVILCGLIVMGFVMIQGEGEQPVEGCQKDDGTFLEDYEIYTYISEGQCNSCICWEGEVSCSPVQCYWPQCRDDASPIYREGSCCPSCP